MSDGTVGAGRGHLHITDLVAGYVRGLPIVGSDRHLLPVGRDSRKLIRTWTQLQRGDLTLRFEESEIVLRVGGVCRARNVNQRSVVRYIEIHNGGR